jgi:hypothetical protein
MQVVRRLEGNQAAVAAVLSGIWDGWTGHGGGFDDARPMPLAVRRLLRV